MAPLDWQPIPQDGGGPSFPVLFQAAASGGTLALAVHDRQRAAGAGLTSVPARIASLAWRSLEASHGGPRFPRLFGAAAAGGTLVAGVHNIAGEEPAADSGAALAFIPAATIGRLDFAQVSQNIGGPGLPELFSAAIPQGALLAAVDNRHAGPGTGLALVPAKVTALTWRPLEQSHGGPRFPQAFAAAVAGGTLVLADLDREGGTGVGIAFVPGDVTRLDWVQLDQVQGGPRFPRHFRAPAAGGGLVLSLFDKDKGTGVDLAFLAGG